MIVYDWFEILVGWAMKGTKLLKRKVLMKSYAGVYVSFFVDLY